jgi:XTP/dITP diphosphohydrolase
VRLVLATRNAHKLREFERLLPTVELEPLPEGIDLPPEDGDTYAANALIKARAAAAATGRTAIADDSGIEAEALGGAPGVRTARYAGPHATDAQNLAKLAAEAPPGGRLRYVCAIAHVTPGGEEHVFERTCSGTLAAQPRGDRGFGYDPLFVPDEHSGATTGEHGGSATGEHGGSATGERGARTMAELSDAEKDAISHRGRAARALADWLGRGGGP